MITDFRLSSEPGERKGFFEFRVSGPLRNLAQLSVYWQFDDDGKTRTRYLPLSMPSAGILMIDQTGFLLDETGCWQRRTAPAWSFCADAEHTTQPFAATGVPDHEGGYIRFSLASYLGPESNRSYLQQAIPVYSWSAPTLTLEQLVRERARTRLRFRTPNDQRRYGTLLGELTEEFDATGNKRVFRSFIIDRPSPLRLNTKSLEEISEKLEAVDAASIAEDRDRLVIEPDDKDILAKMIAAYRLSQAIGLLPCEGERWGDSPHYASRFQEGMGGATLYFIDHLQASLKKGEKLDLTGSYINKTLTELDAGYFPLINAANQDTDLLCDDPGILWAALQRALGIYTLNQFQAEVYQALIRSPFVPIKNKIRLCATVSEFGCPLAALQEEPLPGDEGPLLDAVRHARWCWPPTEGDLAACEKYLDSDAADGEAQLAAIDSLIRWGRFDLIPAPALKAWLETRRVGTPTSRHWTWKALSRTPEGRELLRKTMTEAEKDWSTHTEMREIAQILKLRAEATLELKRFDFMSETECRETLKVCASVKP